MNILIVGVGGQGTLLSSRLIGKLAQNKGLDVKMSEVHGMSQRGGSVVTYVRFSEKVYSPIIEKGEADIILGFEELEAYRYSPYLKQGGLLIANKQNILPMPVITGAQTYPSGLLEKLSQGDINLKAIDALSLARQAGNEKTVNVVLMGVMANSNAMPEFSTQDWIHALESTVPQKLLEVNKAAFELGLGV